MSVKKRLCKNCGEETELEYTDEEWEVRGEECEQCEIEELLVLDII